jgi:hypothetical protein
MLSSLPKLADRTFILGAFLPTLLFAIVGLFLFRDQEPANAWIEILTKKDLGQAAYLLLAVWAGAVMVLMLNLPLYRFLEGYTFPGWLAERLKSRNRKRLRYNLGEIQILHDRWAEQGSAFGAADLDRYQMLRYELVRRMPSRESDVLPTRFGNAIKAFEVYPRDIYGADGVAIWLRLMSVIPKSFVEQIQDIRSQIDCLVNCCFFSAVIALLGVVHTLQSARWHDIDLHTVRGGYAFISSIEWFWLLWTAGGIIAAYLFYRWAVTRVPAWGELVMSAFDCYLPALAVQLGFELPATEAMRQRFWTTFSQQLIYRRGPTDKLPFRIEEWKQVASKTSNKELPPSAEGDHDKAEKNDDEGDSNDP